MNSTTTSSDSVRIAFFDTTIPDKFLIVTEADDKENWKLVGGKLEPNENPDDAALRETMEEIGLSPVDIQLTQAGELQNDDGISKRYIYIGYTTAASIKPSDEIAATKWITEEAIPAGNNQHHMLSAVQLARHSNV